MNAGKYRDRPWGSRFTALGDEAEGVYDAVLPLGPSDRYGLRRPDIDIRKLDPFVRFTPDRIAASGPLVEVVGLGRDDTSKWKPAKVEALSAWNRNVSVYVFVWNSHRKEWLLLPFPSLRSLYQRVLKRDGMQRFSSDNNPYVALPWRALTLAREVVRGEYRA